MEKIMTGRDVAARFAETSAGGSFIFRAEDGHELLFANNGMADLFECSDTDEFMEFVGRSYDGMVNDDQLKAVLTDIKMQIKDSTHPQGYVFFNITTKEGNVRRVVNHFILSEDESGERLFYSYIFPHRHDNVGSDFDPLTDLYGRRQFIRYAQHVNNEHLTKNNHEKFAVIYLNLVNFKLLNIEHGVTEGDSCLKVIADLLKKTYDGAYISRVSGDHFVIFSKYENILKKCEQVRNIFFDSYGMRYGVIIKFGIYQFAPSPDLDVESALSQAKIACDFIKYKSNEDIVEYSEELVKDNKTNDYVIARIDDALKNGWIKVYYQPVVRSITGSLCSFESLARWIDPEIGFLSPDKFIGALENERCIHKLDSYIVEQVCKDLHDRLEKKLPVVPVSVNFSRLDFILCDMLKVIEDLVEKYDIPRDYLHIEITESMIASDADLMRNVMESFNHAGYEIWMDDFGSGYSSLTLLKEYKFDTLKLDMNFLNPFTEKSKSVVRSTITMAKDIGMKTLCEGVETKEHLEYLRDIGCGMIQGYYYSPPKPLEEIFEVLKEKNIPIETRKLRHIYEVASFHAKYTDTPLQILEDNKRELKSLFMNRKYREEIFDPDETGKLVIPETLEEIDRLIYHSGSALEKKHRAFADLVERTGKRETMYLTANDSYFCLTAQVIARYSTRYMIEVTIVNISHDRWVKENMQLDSRLRELNLLFEDVMLVNLEEDTISPLLGGFKYMKFDSGKTPDLQEVIKHFVKENVILSEQEKCLEFLRSSNLYERIRQSDKGYIEHAFRLKHPDGNYKWTETYLMLIPGSQGNEYIFCTKSFTEKSSDLIEKETRPDYITDKISEFSNIYANLVMDSRIKFFWKDKDRRFMGLSRAFLDYFGFETEKDLIGNTDEDLEWLIEDEPMRKVDLEVINKGEHFWDVSAQCVVNGVVHNIIYNKMPLYKDGEIIGIIGYFVDRDEEIERVNKKLMPSKLDEVTGLMNSHAFIDSMIEFAKRYNSEGIDYSLILFNNASHSRLIDTYDRDFANAVLKKIGEHIISVTKNTCPVARMKDSVFAILLQTDSEKELEKLALGIKKELNGIKDIDGNSITLRMKMSYKLRSLHKASDESLYEDLLKNIS